MARIINTNSRKIREFELHPAAKAAIDFFHSIPSQFHLLPVEIRRFIGHHNIIRGVIVDERFLMFDPVWTLKLWMSNRPPSDCLLVGYHAHELSDEQIATITWANTLNIVFSSMSKNNGLLKLHESLNLYLPASIKNQLGVKRSKLSERELAIWADVGAGTIPEQRRQQAKNIDSIQGDIFDGLKRSVKPKRTKQRPAKRR